MVRAAVVISNFSLINRIEGYQMTPETVKLSLRGNRIEMGAMGGMGDMLHAE
jgi:hypothetical protein